MCGPHVLFSELCQFKLSQVFFFSWTAEKPGFKEATLLGPVFSSPVLTVPLIPCLCGCGRVLASPCMELSEGSLRQALFLTFHFVWSRVSGVILLGFVWGIYTRLVGPAVTQGFFSFCLLSPLRNTETTASHYTSGFAWLWRFKLIASALTQWIVAPVLFSVLLWDTAEVNWPCSCWVSWV